MILKEPLILQQTLPDKTYCYFNVRYDSSHQYLSLPKAGCTTATPFECFLYTLRHVALVCFCGPAISY